LIAIINYLHLKGRIMQQSKTISLSQISSAMLLALGLAASGYFISNGIRYFRNFDRFVEVKGLAEQNVKSDLASWNLNFSNSGNDLKDLYAQMSSNQQQLLSYLHKSGFSESEIQQGAITVTDNWANQYGSGSAKLPHYQVISTVLVNSSNVDLVTKASQNTGELVKEGIILTSSNLSYFYQGLNTIKAQLINTATQNAQQAALTFAKNAGSELGSIKTANQGVVAITSPDGSVINDTNNVYKKVRVVTSIQFFLKN
jgi:hypothetical protein